MADAQIVLLVLLAIARDAESSGVRTEGVRAAMARVEEETAAVLASLADRAGHDGAHTAALASALAGLERSAVTDVAGADTAEIGTLELYRELVVAVNRAASRHPQSAMTIGMKS